MTRPPLAAAAPIVLLALLALLTLGAGAAPAQRAVHLAAPARADPLAPLTPALCPAGSLPDGDACVRLPPEGEDAPEALSVVNAHHDKRGRWVVYDQIPRRPDRPADYDAYRYPVPCAGGVARPPKAAGASDCVVSGYDLDRPDDAQRRGWRLSHVGHGGVDLPQPRGTPVTLLPLEHQEGDAQVVYVGPLFGTTVVTRQTVREGCRTPRPPGEGRDGGAAASENGGRLRDYVVLFGHLDAPAPGVAPGTTLRAGDTLGFVGDTGSPELVHLHLETRRVRDGVDASKLSPAQLVSDEYTVVCDPRNVLPLR